MGILNVVSGLWSAYSSNKAGKDARDASIKQSRLIMEASRESESLARGVENKNVALMEAETAEEARRLSYSQEQQQDQAMAFAAASGVQSGTGSMAGYLSELGSENTSQLDWLKAAGASEVDVMRTSGAATRAAARNSAFIQASGIRDQGDIARTAGTNQMFGSLINVAGTVAGGWG